MIYPWNDPVTIDLIRFWLMFGGPIKPLINRCLEKKITPEWICCTGTIDAVGREDVCQKSQRYLYDLDLAVSEAIWSMGYDVYLRKIA